MGDLSTSRARSAWSASSRRTAHRVCANTFSSAALIRPLSFLRLSGLSASARHLESHVAADEFAVLAQQNGVARRDFLRVSCRRGYGGHGHRHLHRQWLRRRRQCARVTWPSRRSRPFMIERPAARATDSVLPSNRPSSSDKNGLASLTRRAPVDPLDAEP
jgi:hypothetical protein